MNSDLLRSFSTWVNWPLSEGEVRAGPAVYVFRMADSVHVCRLKGESDIIYIGCSQKSLRQRLRDHLRCSSQVRNVGYRLKRVQHEIGPLQVAWKYVEKSDRALEDERRLLASYESDHLEFPPLNRQESGKRLNQFERMFAELSEDDKKRFFSIAIARFPHSTVNPSSGG